MRLGEDHEVVADPFEVGHDVGREDDRHPRLRDDLHHRLHELAPRERVERRDRLIEKEQLRSLRERQRQRDLSLLAAGELADLLFERQPQSLDPVEGCALVPARVELPAELQRLADREPAIERVLLRDEADLRKHRARALARRSAKHLARCRCSACVRPTASWSSVVLPAPFGPTSAVTDPAGISSVQSWSAHFEP